MFIERCWRSLKYEEVCLHAYEDLREARSRIGRYLRYYSQGREYHSLGGLTRWAARYARVVASWEEDLASVLRFYSYSRPQCPYLRSTNLLERFHREIRRGTKIRDHPFPKPDSARKPVYLGSERYEGRWDKRKLEGFGEAEHALQAMFNDWWPSTQSVTQKS